MGSGVTGIAYMPIEQAESDETRLNSGKLRLERNDKARAGEQR